MVVIKDMEMPKACYLCPLLDGEYGTCNIIGETKIDMTEERAKDCPLVEIVTCKDCKYRAGNTCDLFIKNPRVCIDGKRSE